MIQGIRADTLRDAHGAGSGIPDMGIRVIVLVGALFVLSILFVLIYFKMREAEQGGGVGPEGRTK
jgi:hypothetical protein